MIAKLFQVPVVKLMAVLPMFVLGNIMLGVVLAEFEQEFDMDAFKRGLFKGIIIYLSMAVILTAAIPLKDELTIVIGGNEYTVMNAMKFILWSSIVIYAQDFFSKLIDVFQIETVEREDNYDS